MTIPTVTLVLVALVFVILMSILIYLEIRERLPAGNKHKHFFVHTEGLDVENTPIVSQPFQETEV